LLSFEQIRSFGRFLWCAKIAVVVVTLGAAPALVHAQADADPGKTEEPGETVEEEANTGAAWENKPYTVVDGKVDFGTYDGYRRYEAYCLRCHGPDGAGSSYAPALAESLKTLSYEQFLETVVYGRKNVTASQQSVMPAFGAAIDVMENIDDIYSYLEARADGVVGRGRPERLPK
jgi:methanol metabolism-related c-type cytochrome